MGDMMDYLRQVRDGLIFRQQLQSAAFLSDKILALPNASDEDVFILAKCLYRLKEFQRAAYIITIRNLHLQNISCALLVVKCKYQCKQYLEASELTKSALVNYDSDANSSMWKVPLFIMQSLLYQALDNQKSAKDAMYEALKLNFCCYEAFYMLTRQHMLTKAEELTLLNKKIIELNNDKAPFMCAFMRFFYYIQLKKYDKPDNLETYPPFDNIFSQNTDFLVALAERHYYNCKYTNSLEVSTSLLNRDLHNFEGLLFHVSCLVEFKRTNDLFQLAQKLIDLYPEREISWYTLGCYYHLIEKVDLARRFLLKSTTLNSFFAPSWLLYGHSFSQESEHDQAISAYFRASHFMPGCHLPLLYIGVEYILTDNFKLGEKFIKKALSIAPDDPLALHELGIIGFNMNEILNAEKYFRSALRVLKYQPNSLSLPNRYDILLNNMGHVMRKLGRYADAIEFHKKALMLSPQNASCYSYIGLIYCMMGKWKEAVENLDYAHGLFKLLRYEDQHNKTLLENHALRQFANVCRYSLSFTNNDKRFSDKEYVEKMCDQAPKKITMPTKSKRESTELSLLDESSTMLDTSMDITIGNGSLRML